jgi:hypothetical protein
MRIARRSFLAAAAPLLGTRLTMAFGQDGSFNPRPLLVSGSKGVDPIRESGLARWAWELMRSTSAPARLVIKGVAPDEPALLAEPFVVWLGSTAVPALLDSEVVGLRRFFELGGIMFVDDSNPANGEFGKSVRRELRRVLPDVPITPLPEGHVVYKSYYLLRQPVGRVQGPLTLDSMRRGQSVCVLISDHDVLGALARQGETWSLPMDLSDPMARSYAVRFAVNIGMFVLCLDYKDDQVHAEELMRRRGRSH